MAISQRRDRPRISVSVRVLLTASGAATGGGEPPPVDGSEPAGVAVRRGTPQPILLRIAYIGRYIAVTIVPMIVPRMTIITGSSSVIRPAIAVSTSSS